MMTKGPWIARRGFYGAGATADVIESESKSIAHMDKVMWATNGSKEVAEMEANARAIAQVPRMVEFIEAVVKLSTMGMVDVGTLAVDARAILAALEGEK